MYNTSMNTRDILVEATRELLWAKGYAATSPRAIMDASGVGQGSMYHHFRGKEALAYEAIERNAEEMRAQVVADLAAEGSSLEKIRTYLGRKREVLKGCRFGKLVQDADVVKSPRLSSQVDDTLAWVQAQLAAVISDGVERGEFPSELNPIRTAAAIAATLQGAYVLARAAQDPNVFENAVGGVLDLLAFARI